MMVVVVLQGCQGGTGSPILAAVLLESRRTPHGEGKSRAAGLVDSKSESEQTSAHSAIQIYEHVRDN